MRQEITEEQIRQYLLGELGDEAQRLEARLMTEDDVFDELLIQEDELIEEYLTGTLSAKEKESFERHFLLTPQRREKLKFAEGLRRYVAGVHARMDPRPVRSSFGASLLALLRSQRPALRYSFQAIPLLTLAVGLWMIWTMGQLRTEISEVRTRQSAGREKEQQLQQQLNDQTGRSQELQQQLALMASREREVAGTNTSSLESITLTPGMVRDFGTLKSLIIPAATRLVELKLESIGDHHERYRVVIQDSRGSEVCSLSKVTGHKAGAKRTVVVPVPAEVLSEGNYSLRLSGSDEAGNFEDLDQYFFRIVRQK